MRLALLTVAASFAASCAGSPVAATPPVSVQPAAVSTPTYTLSGTVVERTATGLQPIAGVEVGIYSWNEDVLVPEALAASAVTDSAGRYSLQAARQVWWVGATKSGYRYYAERIGVVNDDRFDIELIKSSLPVAAP